ncbi:hypothetical protein L6R46_13490 [Myxococcota bacterium]|nr:hypothetical protein [Myxococcota bacterium]
MRLFALALALPMLTACDLILSHLPKGGSEPGYPGETGISVGETGIDPGETGETGQIWVGEPLETAGVKGDTRDLTATGTLVLSGTSPDYSLTVGEAASFDLHVVELADLSALQGDEVSVTTIAWGFEPFQSLLVNDASGPVFAVDAGWSLDAVNAWLGTPALAWSEELGATEDESWEISHRGLKITHDDGVQVLMPGESQSVSLGGVIWLVTVIQAQDRTIKDGAAMPDCPVLDDPLSYQLQRQELFTTVPNNGRTHGLGPYQAGCM